MKKIKNENRGKFFCYNPEQAKFYLNNQAELLYVNIHKKTHKPFYVFKYSDHKRLFSKWIENKNK